MRLPERFRTDRTNLYAQVCGAVSLVLSAAMAGFPCHALAQDDERVEGATPTVFRELSHTADDRAAGAPSTGITLLTRSFLYLSKR